MTPRLGEEGRNFRCLRRHSERSENVWNFVFAFVDVAGESRRQSSTDLARVGMRAERN